MAKGIVYDEIFMANVDLFLADPVRCADARFLAGYNRANQLLAAVLAAYRKRPGH